MSFFKKGIIKPDLSDKLPVILLILFSRIDLINISKLHQNSFPAKLKKRIFSENNPASFKAQISNINWYNLNSNQCSANSLFETFLNIFNQIYDVNFPLTEIEIKP